MIERTLLIVKPDAVAKKIIGEIVHRIEKEGFKIVNIIMVALEKPEAEAFYQMHRGQYFFDPLIEFMISGPCVPMVIEGQNAIENMRKIVGATDPAEAEEGTIRKDFATDGRRNAVHASDSPKSAEKEIAFFFNPNSLLFQRSIAID